MATRESVNLTRPASAVLADAAGFESNATAALRARFRGALLRPTEEGYDEARRIWNGGIDRRPVLIARCAGTDDVVHAIRFAREHDLPVSVKGGGHGVAGHAVCDGGVMIDLSLMRGVRVDGRGRVARASGGALLGDLDRATQQFGLATPAGLVSHTGIGGLTLGGGLGSLMRKHGLTVDNLLAVDLVTADGERVRVDAEREPELFWGVRGGGGNFGIATGFEYRLHPVGPFVLGGPIFWPLAEAPYVLRAFADFAREAPDELGLAFTLRLAPPSPFLHPSHFGKPVLGILFLWAGDHAAGERAIDAMRAVGMPIGDGVRPAPYVALQSQLDGGNPHGARYYWRSQRVPALTGHVIDALIAQVETITSPTSYIAAMVVGGQATRVGAEETAVGRRDFGYEINMVAMSPPTAPEPERHVAWVRAGWGALRPYGAGAFAYFLSDEGQGAVESAYGERLERLTRLKDRWDPTNVFRLNANIRPSRNAAHEGRSGGANY
jgi:FAD/FMN-containing dehydrogenase